MTETVHVLDVEGELACFTSPVSKVERFSLPCITPSAARGIFDAIYCKPPEFRWEIRRIEIINPVQYIGLRRNETKEKASVRAVHEWMQGRAEPEPILADADAAVSGTDQKGRTQRQTMALKNVRYRLHGIIIPWPGFERNHRAFDAQFRRRASHGKCVYQPYLGMREFPAYFELLEGPVGEPRPQPLDQDLGFMVYDVFDHQQPGTPEDAPSISVFRAVIKSGVLDVPSYASDAVYRTYSEGEA